MKYFALFSLLTTLLFCAPALQRERSYIQEDGTMFKGTLKGDEYLHWIEDSSGNILKFNKKTQNYDFAKIEQKQLKPSGEVYNSKRAQTRSLKKRVHKDELRALWKTLRQDRALRHSHSKH